MNCTDLAAAPGYWYLATPYSRWSRGLDDAALEAARLTGRLLRANVRVYSPIVHSHAVAAVSGLGPVSHEFWMWADAPMIEAAHGLLVADMDGWTLSAGVTAEIAAFGRAGKPVLLLCPTTLLAESFTRATEPAVP
jgi:hypothetical protein